MTLKQIHAKQLLGRSTDQGALFNATYTIDAISFVLGELEKLYKIEEEVIWQNVLTEIVGHPMAQFCKLCLLSLVLSS